MKQLFTTSSLARSSGAINEQVLGVVPEDCHILQSEDEETDIGDSPCPPPSKNTGFRAKKLGLGGTRGPLKRTETWTLSGFS